MTNPNGCRHRVTPEALAVVEDWLGRGEAEPPAPLPVFVVGQHALAMPLVS